jgi:hypothetical protein
MTVFFQNPMFSRYDEADGSLCCVLKQASEKLRIRSWQECCRVEQLRESGPPRPGENPWIDVLDKIDLPILSPKFTEENPSVARYAATLPPDTAKAVAAFPCSQLVLLRVCASSERSGQLLRTHPTLFWLVAPSLLRRAGGSPEKLHDLLGLRRRELLAPVCGRDSEQLVRILNRIQPPKAAQEPHITSWALRKVWRYAASQRRLLLDILRSGEAVALLRHRQDIPWDVLTVVNLWKERISDKIVRSILTGDMNAQEMEEALAARESARRDTLRLGLTLRSAEARGIVVACGSWRQLLRLHDTWTERLNNHRREFAHRRKFALSAGRNVFFPAPPIPGNEHIRPVLDESMLLEEGRTMRHCVAGHWDSIHRGKCYIYRIERPARELSRPARVGGRWANSRVIAMPSRERMFGRLFTPGFGRIGTASGRYCPRRRNKHETGDFRESEN